MLQGFAIPSQQTDRSLKNYKKSVKTVLQRGISDDTMLSAMITIMAGLDRGALDEFIAKLGLKGSMLEILMVSIELKSGKQEKEKVMEKFHEIYGFLNPASKQHLEFQ